MENDTNSSLDMSENEPGLPRKNIDDIVDHAIFLLKKDCFNNKQKTLKNWALLEKLGFNVNDLPPKTLKEMNAVFEDNEVFNFNDVGSSELVTVNPSAIVDSLQTNKHLADLGKIKSQFEAMLSKFQNTNKVVQEELDREKAHTDMLNEQINEKSVLKTKIKMKLDEAQREHQKLESLYKDTEKPRYTMENLNEMLEEKRRLEEDLAITSTHLDKYNNLPLSEKEAAKQLNKIKQELSNVDNEIKKQVNSEV